jgi:hypothetical protein
MMTWIDVQSIDWDVWLTTFWVLAAFTSQSVSRRSGGQPGAYGKLATNGDNVLTCTDPDAPTPWIIRTVERFDSGGLWIPRLPRSWFWFMYAFALVPALLVAHEALKASSNVDSWVVRAAVMGPSVLFCAHVSRRLAEHVLNGDVAECFASPTVQLPVGVRRSEKPSPSSSSTSDLPEVAIDASVESESEDDDEDSIAEAQGGDQIGTTLPPLGTPAGKTTPRTSSTHKMPPLFRGTTPQLSSADSVASTLSSVSVAQVTVSSRPTMGPIVYLGGLAHYAIAPLTLYRAALAASHVAECIPHTSDSPACERERWPLYPPQVGPSYLALMVLALALGVAAEAVQAMAHAQLRSYRIKRDPSVPRTYVLPKGGLFDWSLHPHYAAEVTSYLAWTLLVAAVVYGHPRCACGSDRNILMALFCMAAWTLSNLSITAHRSLRWYKDTFGVREVGDRAAMVPGVI